MGAVRYTDRQVDFLIELHRIIDRYSSLMTIYVTVGEQDCGVEWRYHIHNIWFQLNEACSPDERSFRLAIQSAIFGEDEREFFNKILKKENKYLYFYRTKHVSSRAIVVAGAHIGTEDISKWYSK